MAGVKKLRTSPYHSQTNGQCENFNSTPFNILQTLTPEQKKDWKSHVPALVHASNCTRNAATGFSPYYLLFNRKPRLPVDVEFGLQRGSQKASLCESAYISQLRRRLKFAHNKAKQMVKRQQARHKGLYDQKCRGAELKVGDLALVKQTAWKGRHKIQDRGRMRSTRWWTSIPLVFLYVLLKASQGADLGSFIGICYSACKGELDGKMG